MTVCVANNENVIKKTLGQDVFQNKLSMGGNCQPVDIAPYTPRSHVFLALPRILQRAVRTKQLEERKPPSVFIP